MRVLGPLSRRTMLRGGGACIALPLLEAMSPRGARAAGRGKKFVFVSSPNGVVPAAFWPQSELAEAFGPGKILEPLKEHAADIVLCKGIQNKAALDTGVPASHPEGNFTLLTGSPPSGVVGQNFGMWKASRASIDQVIAPVLGPTAFSTLNIGSDGSDWSGAVAFDEKLQLIANLSDPKTLFKRMFVDAHASLAERKKLQDRRSSVLDATLASCKRLQDRISGEDKHRFAAHCEEIRNLELRLRSNMGCGAPPPDLGVTSYQDISVKYDELPRILDELSRLLVLALACGLTNVATFVLKRGGGGSYYASFLGPEFNNSNGANEIHEMSHRVGQPLWDPSLVKIARFFMGQVATLVQRLKDVSQPDGRRLFDDVILLHGSEVGEGNHGKNDIPFFLLGNAGGAWKPGRFARFDNVPHNQLLVTLLQTFGVPNALTYGDTERPGALVL